MICKKELSCINKLAEVEMDSLEAFRELSNSVSEPQLRTEIQNVISSHRNHISKLLALLENDNEKQ